MLILYLNLILSLFHSHIKQLYNIISTLSPIFLLNQTTKHIASFLLYFSFFSNYLSFIFIYYISLNHTDKKDLETRGMKGRTNENCYPR